MRRGPAMGVLAIAAAAGCASLTELAPGIAFLEVRGPAPPAVTVGSTITLTAVALGARGDTVPATFEWVTPDTAFVQVDPATGQVTGRQPTGAARVQARTGTIASPFFTLTVTAPVAP